jgi:hypothetical protein
VTDSSGKLIMESILATEAATILQFFAGLRGTLSVTFEEGTWSAWLYDLLNPRVDKLVVCNPRKNALLKDGNKSDRIDACKLAELLRGNQLKSVYHGETGVRMLRELSLSYLTIVKDLARVMNRLKAVANENHFISGKPHFDKAKSKNSSAGFRNPASTDVSTHTKNCPIPALSRYRRTSAPIAVRVFAQTPIGIGIPGNISDTAGIR